jgi:lysophospholipase L1-like esterase
VSKLLTLSLCALLAACGGGGGGEPDAPLPQSEPAVLIVETYGDSTQAGHSSLGQSPSVAQDYLGVQYSVRNRGVGSTNTKNLLEGDGFNLPWDQQMKQSPASVVVINHGINDHPYPIEQYRDNLAKLVYTARDAGKTVVLETPNPIIPGGAISGDWDIDALAERVEMMRAVAAGTGAFLCDQDKAIRSAGQDTLEFFWDGVHPSAKGYLVKGSKLAQCIKAASTL